MTNPGCGFASPRRHRDPIQVEVVSRASRIFFLPFFRLARETKAIYASVERQLMMAMNSGSLLSRLQLSTYDRTHLATLPKDTGQRTRTNGRARGHGDSKVALARATCHKCKLSIFQNTTLAGLVRSNVAVCVPVLCIARRKSLRELL